MNLSKTQTLSLLVKNYPVAIFIAFVVAVIYSYVKNDTFTFLMSLAFNFLIIFVGGLGIAAMKIDTRRKLEKNQLTKNDLDSTSNQLILLFILIIAAIVANYYFVPTPEINKATFKIFAVIASILAILEVFFSTAKYISRKIDKSLEKTKLSNLFYFSAFIFLLVFFALMIKMT